jgi:hypothetical protein
MKHPSSPLRPYERHVACILSGILAGLGLFAAIEGRHNGVNIGETMTIHVVGAVRKTEVTLSLGATLDDVLTCIELNEGAEISELDGSRRLINGEIVVIPYVGKTTLYVTGAVIEPKVVVLVKNAKPREVLEFVQLQNDADEAMFLRRRTLRNGSVIDIKKKKKAVQNGVTLQ